MEEAFDHFTFLNRLLFLDTHLLSFTQVNTFGGSSLDLIGTIDQVTIEPVERGRNRVSDCEFRESAGLQHRKPGFLGLKICLINNL
jgi:hypothetical protein